MAARRALVRSGGVLAGFGLVMTAATAAGSETGQELLGTFAGDTQAAAERGSAGTAAPDEQVRRIEALNREHDCSPFGPGARGRAGAGRCPRGT